MTTPAEVTAAWASAQVTDLLGDLADEPPGYGSTAWLALPPDDPRRPAALIAAAEKWRRMVEEPHRLDYLAEFYPAAWYQAVFGSAAEEAIRRTRELARGRPTFAELEERRRQRPAAHVVQAAPGWSPVAIPGRPGWWRHYIDGAQVDLPSREAPEQQQEAA